MESYYLIILICLVVLAVSDLVVGVSNDAVNFLNSALGSKAGTRRTIMFVATAGILIGAVSSSGMMEIARKGIFNPEMFSFADIMIVFLAVMVTDIILLDLFNTFGMPTSTTVSIMFELLGAAFMVACIKIILTGDSLSTLSDYLNTDNAILIIAGIFLSVLIAFTIGMFVQYIVRLIFSFDIKKSMKKYGAVFGGVAITTITYFLLIKGMKGSSLLNEALVNWISQNTILLIALITAFWIGTCWLLVRLFNLNILKFVVLSGTFSLAMAFAGNDLVNFIGVPLAGLQSYDIFQSAGVSPDELGMGLLGEKLQTNTFILLAAGLVMIATLWFSKKARSVTDTEINLASESVGKERFNPNLLSRLIVRGGLNIGKYSNRILNDSFRERVDRRFEKRNRSVAAAKEQPAFDMVRASVNLMVASVLIAFATSLKLPLSTTYVSFMVAMGTSLADRAWSRDSAVYRVAGVVNVIGGWLFTALVAFTAAAVLALVIYFGGIYAVVGLMILTAFLIIRSQFLHKKLELKRQTSLQDLMKRDSIKRDEVFSESEQRISNTLYKISFILKDLVRGLKTGDQKTIEKAKREVTSYSDSYEELSSGFYHYLRKIDSDSTEEGQFYLHVLNYLQNISQSIHLIGEKVFSHVRNVHSPMLPSSIQELEVLSDEVGQLFMNISELMGESRKGNFKLVEDRATELLQFIMELEENHIARIQSGQGTQHSSMLYVAILLEMRDILNDFTGLVGLFEGSNGLTPSSPDKDRSLMLN